MSVQLLLLKVLALMTATGYRVSFTREGAMSAMGYRVSFTRDFSNSSTPNAGDHNCRPMLSQDELENLMAKRSDVNLIKPLGMGGFGIAYQAEYHYVRDNGTEQKRPVAVKFIYKKDRGAPKIARSSSRQCSEGMDKPLDALKQECELMQSLQAPELVRKNPQGAEHILKCFLNCHDSSEDCKISPDDPPFIALDFAGMDGYRWMTSHLADTKAPAMASVLNDVLRGVVYMSETHEPPLIHHDLKWGNILVRETSPSSFKATIIDFGETVECLTEKPSNDTRGEGLSISTMGYAPPEWGLKYDYKFPCWSFDVYSLGAMALEGLCKVSHEDLQTHMQKTALLVKEGVPPTEVSRKDEGRYTLALMEELCKKVPEEQMKCCKMMEFLIHPEPRWRTKPSNIEFHSKHGVVSAKWAARQRLKRKLINSALAVGGSLIKKGLDHLK